MENFVTQGFRCSMKPRNTNMWNIAWLIALRMAMPPTTLESGGRGRARRLVDRQADNMESTPP